MFSLLRDLSSKRSQTLVALLEARTSVYLHSYERTARIQRATSLAFRAVTPKQCLFNSL